MRSHSQILKIRISTSFVGTQVNPWQWCRCRATDTLQRYLGGKLTGCGDELHKGSVGEGCVEDEAGAGVLAGTKGGWVIPKHTKGWGLLWSCHCSGQARWGLEHPCSWGGGMPSRAGATPGSMGAAGGIPMTNRILEPHNEFFES